MIEVQEGISQGVFSQSQVLKAEVDYSWKSHSNPVHNLKLNVWPLLRSSKIWALAFQHYLQPTHFLNFSMWLRARVTLFKSSSNFPAITASPKHQEELAYLRRVRAVHSAWKGPKWHMQQLSSKICGHHCLQTRRYCRRIGRDTSAAYSIRCLGILRTRLQQMFIEHGMANMFRDVSSGIPH